MLNDIRLLIIGRYSFISQHLKYYLDNKVNVKVISFEKFKTLSKKKLMFYNFICNCTITKSYRDKKYNTNFDNDFFIAKKIKDLKIKLIFLSTRKIYFPQSNIKENSKKIPKDNYSKNKLISENKLHFLLKRRLLILRISNLIGSIKYIKKKRKISNTFIYNFLNLKKNGIIYYHNYFKDFLSIEQFCKIFYKILQKNLFGIYNVSLGKKVYVNEILTALNKNKKMKRFVKINEKLNDNFYLNNNKLLKKINIKIIKKDLIDYCYNI